MTETESVKSVPSPEEGQALEKLTLDSLLDACFGFALSVSCVVLAYVEAVWAQYDQLLGGVYAVCMSAAVAAALVAGWLGADRLQAPRGRTFLLVVYSLCLAVSVTGCALGAYPLVIVAASISLVGAGFLYSGFLNMLPRTTLMTVIDVLILCVGAFILVFVCLDGVALLVMHAVAAAIALALTAAFIRKRAAAGEPVIGSDESKAHDIPLKGNRHTLFLIGFMFSAIELGFWLEVPQLSTRMVWLVLGGVVAGAGLFSFLIRGLDEKEYKSWLLKGMGAYAAILLLPITVFGGVAQIVFLSLFVFLTTLNVIVVINAVIESARFNMISPIWLYGKEGSMFFIGVMCGAALFCAGGWLSLDNPWVLNATIALAVMVCAVMQLRVNYQCYPFESVLDHADADDDIAAVQEESGRRRTLWHRKIQTACERYKLSPREREVLQILLRGRDTKYVMDTFCISQSTAKTHIYNIYRKFDVHSRQDLLDFIEEIDPDDADGE